MEPACEASAAPYTLLGLLLQGNRPVVPSSVASRPRCGGAGDFLRDYAARATNALLWFTLIAVTALLLRRLGRLVRLWARGSRIPGPPCPSFYGHANLIPVGGDITGYLSNLHEKYGSIVRLWLGPTQLLVSVTDPAMIQEVLVKAEDKLPLTGKAFRLAFGRSSLFAPSFDKVQKKRECLGICLNGKLLERANTIPSKVVHCVMERVNSAMTKGIVDCRSISQHMAFYILGATVFGDAFLAWSNATVYEELLMMVARDASFWASYNIPPVWKGGFRRYQHLCSRLKCLTGDILQRCRENYNLLGQISQSSNNKTKEMVQELEPWVRSFVLDDLTKEGMLFEEMDKYLISKDEPCGNIMGMMFHGCLTTAGLIGSILTRLVLHPEIQEKIYLEIIKVRKGASLLDPNGVQKMQFLLATVYESARLLPAGPLLQRCSLKRDLNLKTSITVPAGAIFVVPVQLVQMDDSLWGQDACRFNPYRFLSTSIETESSAAVVEPDSMSTTSLKDASVAEKKSQDSQRIPSFPSLPNLNGAFLPFGSGTRACIGQKYAILGISTLFASLLQEYEIKFQPGSENDPEPTMNERVLQLPPSPKILFVKRKC